ncbi:MAG: N-acetylornithine carbamoyltransferase [Flavobacteriaceae bacterium]|nr:N-acetylornithine carbamoyltransferase [Flavobacteriaceae bacterium]
MNHFLDISSVDNLQAWMPEIASLKKEPLQYAALGKGKTLGMLFFNSSLRTRLSTQKAAQNLGMQTMIMNVQEDAWGLSFEDGVVMNTSSAEHIKEAAAVLSGYCDALAVRAFPSLTDKAADMQERILNGFKKYATVPIVNMESAMGHPLQGLTDAFTIWEQQKTERPKVVLSWAPHIKPLPQSVPNSFVLAMQAMPVDLVICNPVGYNLNPDLVGDTPVIHDQEAAFAGADFVYAKSWSAFEPYGTLPMVKGNWQIDQHKMKLTNQAKFMHCLPVRRNVVVSDAVLDSEASIVISQAHNRTYSAQLVIQKLLKHGME